MMNPLYRIRTEEGFGNGELNLSGGKKELTVTDRIMFFRGKMSEYATSHNIKEKVLKLVREWGFFLKAKWKGGGETIG